MAFSLANTEGMAIARVKRLKNIYTRISKNSAKISAPDYRSLTLINQEARFGFLPFHTTSKFWLANPLVGYLRKACSRKAGSPLQDIWDHVAQIRVPILFVQAEKDTLAVTDDTIKLYEKCKAKNKNAKYLELPDTDHNITFNDPDNVKRIETTLAQLIAV